MSFGFSVGDFLAVGRLISDVTNALRDSRVEYQELVRELESLARALDHVDHLKGPPNQALAIDHIKCAALMCRQPLEDFHRKIQKFEKNLDVGNSRGMLKDAVKKAQWAFGLGKKDEVGRLRTYLDIHIGVINMQLIQYGFEKVDIASEERVSDHLALKSSMDESMREVKDMRGNIQVQTLVVKENSSMIRTLLAMVGGDIGVPLKALTGVVTKVCASTQQIYDIALEIRANTYIDTRFTYLQDPVKAEDVLGRVFPFPAEFSIAALDAEIADRFKVGPGKSQVAAGYYEIFNAKNTNELVGITSDSLLRPGMSISMSIILKKTKKEDGRCLMPYCQSTNVVDTLGGKLCTKCDTWFKNSGKKRKRGCDSSSLLDDPRKKLKSSKQLFRNHDASIKNETNAESDSATSHLCAFKRISFAQGNQAPKHQQRLPRDDELYVMKAFTRHNALCFTCSGTNTVDLSGQSLCSKGLQRAVDVSQYLFSKAGQVFSVVDLPSGQRCQVEIPTDCEVVLQLLMAIESGGLSKLRVSSYSSK